MNFFEWLGQHGCGISSFLHFGVSHLATSVIMQQEHLFCQGKGFILLGCGVTSHTLREKNDSTHHFLDMTYDHTRH